MERITHLSAPPVVGQFYLVPTVTFGWLTDVAKVWPVFLPRHADAQFFNFDSEHYHVDPRFVSARAFNSVLSGSWDGALATAQSKPLGPKRWGAWATEVPTPVWRARKCQRPHAPYQHGHQRAVQGLQAHFAGEQCKRNRAGWVCPHQQWGMGSVAPDAAGVITCPLHGLRVDAASGRVIRDGPLSTPKAAQAQQTQGVG